MQELAGGILMFQACYNTGISYGNNNVSGWVQYKDWLAGIRMFWRATMQGLAN